MTNSKTIQQIKKAQSLGLTIKINRTACVYKNDCIPFFLPKRSELFNFLENETHVFLQFMDSKRVNDKICSKIIAMGFEIKTIFTELEECGRFRHFCTIYKAA